MSTRANKAYVAKIELKNNTYYVTDRPDITLDSQTYSNLVRYWGDVSFNSDTENGIFQIGSFDIELINGEEMLQDGYVFSPTDVWNNYKCTVKLYTDGDVEFDSCEPIISGKIKNYNINNDIISFSIEQIDDRDDILLPAIVCTDQSDLSDAEAIAVPVSTPDYDTITFATGDASIFDTGELVVLTFETYYPEVAGKPYQIARIKSIDATNTTIILWETYEYIFRVVSVEKAFRYIPEKAINKTIPIQIGSLTDRENGEFGKTVTISEKAGRKIIAADYIELNYLIEIGVWENLLKRFFAARGGSASNIIYEYGVNTRNNFVHFVSTAGTTLSTTTSAISGVQEIFMANPENIPWVDEDDVTDTENTDLITNNVIVIDRELFLILKKPSAGNGVLVERGYDDTEVVEHSAGSTVYLVEKFAAKNLLSFREFFYPKSVSTMYQYGMSLEKYLSPTNYGMTGNIENIIKNDLTSVILYMDHYHDLRATGPQGMYFIFDLQFNKIVLDATVSACYVGLDADFTYARATSSAQVFDSFIISVADVNEYISYTDVITYETHTTGHAILQLIRHTGDSGSSTINGVSSAKEDPETLASYDPTYDDIYDANITKTNCDWPPDMDGFGLSRLKDINKRWRFYFMEVTDLLATAPGNGCVATIRKIGLWVDFLVDFTKENVIAPLQGRKITEDVASITGDTEGDICIYPQSVCAQILTQELGYEVDDFGDGWSLLQIGGWTTRTTPNSNAYYEVTFGNNLFVAVGTGASSTVMTSSDGITWTARTSSFSCSSVTYGGGLFVLVTTGGGVATSPDGITWTSRTTPTSNSLNSVTYGNNLYVAVGATSSLDGVITSPDGITWTSRTTPNNNSLNGVTYGNNLFVAVSGSSSLSGVITSPDGITWTSRTTPNNNTYTSVVYGNNLFVAVSASGSLDRAMTSPDGITWTARTTPTNNAYTHVTYGNSLYVSVSSTGSSDKVMTSTDGITWETMVTPNNNYTSVTYGNGTFVAVSFTGGLDRAMTLSTMSQNACAFSYGIEDERKKGFEFVSEIANHYNYLLFKTYNNKLSIVNLYNIYDDTDTGNKIEIEEILFLKESGQRRISIYQTGNDLIYNDVIIKYNRNNSTDEYQSVYTLPDSFTLAKSGITLKQARSDYYGGKKRTLTIESPYIYDEERAQELAETKANEFAEVHFYIELYIDYDHYTDINSLTDQYQIGDIVYLNGDSNGITFDSDRLFYIKDTVITDNGREICLHIKSVDPVSEF